MSTAKTFTVSYGGIRIKVRVLPCAREVHREFFDGACRAKGPTVYAFFAPSKSLNAKACGTIVLPLIGRLNEYIPHEVTHAVCHRLGGVGRNDDEFFATAVGMLSARIFSRLNEIRRAA